MSGFVTKRVRVSQDSSGAWIKSLTISMRRVALWGGVAFGVLSSATTHAQWHLPSQSAPPAQTPYALDSASVLRPAGTQYPSSHQPWQVESPKVPNQSPAQQRFPGSAPPSTPPSRQWYTTEHGPQPYDQQSYPACQWGPGRSAFWYGGAGYLFMTRSDNENIRLSFDTDRVGDRVIDTGHAAGQWASGLDVTVGRVSDCGRSALELRYWGLSSTAEANAYGDQTTGNLHTLIDFSPMVYNNGVSTDPVSDYFLNAERHRLRRSHSLHSVEWNFISQLASTCPTTWHGQPWQIQWVGGLRYIRFDDGLQYAADRHDRVFNNDAECEVYYDIDVQNHLLGGQLGGRFDYCISPRVSWRTSTQVGLFYNHIRHHQFLGGEHCAAVVLDPGSPYHNGAHEFLTTKQDFAVLAELQTGLRYQINCHWSLDFGYRVFALSGVAVSTEQIPPYFEDLPTSRAVDSGSGVLYHGGYATLVYAY